MYQVFTDGSSSKKRGTIGISYVIYKNKNKKFLKHFAKGFIDKQARNGVAELLGVYYFLYHLCCGRINLKEEEIVIYSDSQYVVNEFNIWFRNQLFKNFYNTKNKELIIFILWMLYILREEGFKIKFKWIKGHQKGNTFEIYGNENADFLAFNCHINDIISRKYNGNKLKNIEVFINKLRRYIKEEKIFKKVKKIYLGI